MINEDQIIQEILSNVDLSMSILPIKEFPLPDPHIPSDKEQIKAFILGADPSNFSDNKKTRKISCVFDIGNDKKIFQ